MSAGRYSPRLGLGPERLEPEEARFGSAAQLLQYFCDVHGMTHAQLAARCGTQREQITRWTSGVVRPSLATLTDLLAPLGWAPVLVLERTDAALEQLLADAAPARELLDPGVWAVLGLARAAVAAGLDVVVGGDVAAVLQGVPVPAGRLVLHVRPAHQRALARMAHEHWLHTVEQPTGPAVRSGATLADIRAEPARPPTRTVAEPEDGEPVIVVDLAELCDDADALSPGMRAAAGRLLGRGG